MEHVGIISLAPTTGANKGPHDFCELMRSNEKGIYWMSLKAKPSQCWNPNFLTAAASLIKSKPAEWMNFSSNTGAGPVWTDFSIMTAPSYDATSGHDEVRGFL